MVKELVGKGRQKDGSTRELRLCLGAKRLESYTKRRNGMLSRRGWLCVSRGETRAPCYTDFGLVKLYQPIGALSAAYRFLSDTASSAVNQFEIIVCKKKFHAYCSV
jgi:hypothetical protein